MEWFAAKPTAVMNHGKPVRHILPNDLLISSILVGRADYQPDDARFKVVTFDIICLLIPLPTRRMCVGVWICTRCVGTSTPAGCRSQSRMMMIAIHRM